MNRFLFLSLLIGLLVGSCKKDDSPSCTTCSSDITANFELCQEANGNASVNGEDTGTDYELYFDNLIAAGANCGN
ncbi:MAG: hypothetical protein HKM28_08035 [Flavobacteriaceae bacterium]|nr:hypothetical protein [Flavobacteriaceae bacterium]